VGYCGAEISNLFICSQFSSFAHEGVETTLFHTGYLAFRPPASIDLCLELKSSMMSASFQVWPGDLLTSASSTSLLPIGIQTAVASIERSVGTSAW
jgi:hypothetical protein